MWLAQRFRVATVVVSVVVAAALIWLLLGIASVARHALTVRATASNLLSGAAADANSLAFSIDGLTSATGNLRSGTEASQWRIVTTLPGVGPNAVLVTNLAMELDKASQDLSRAVELSSDAGGNPDDASAVKDSLASAAVHFDAVSEEAYALAGQPVFRPIARSLRDLARGSASLSTSLREAAESGFGEVTLSRTVSN